MNKTILTLLAGIAIGIVLAPDKGSETIKKIRRRVADLKDNAEDQADELVNKGKEAFRNGQSRFENAMG
jgi:gas vesicle protein